jgi:hypothetical protein
VAILSQRSLWNAPYLSHLVEVEDVLVQMLDADLIDFTRHNGMVARSLVDRSRLRVVANPVARFRPFDLPRPDAPYDLAILVTNNTFQLTLLESVPQWRSFATQFVGIMTEAWPQWLPGAQRSLETIIAHFDHLFVSVGAVVDHIAQVSGTPVTYLPHGVDVLRFPAYTGGDRRIDITNLGRRGATQHAVLADWCATTGRYYEFDTGPLNEIDDHAEHRAHFRERCARSRAFVSNYARFDQPDVRHGVIEFGLRYIEALAAGCVIAGEHPAPDRCHAVLGDVAGLVDLPIEATAVPDALVDVLADPDECDRIHRANRILALERHDVLHRWEHMAAALGIAETDGMRARRAALAVELAALAAS